MIQLEKDLHSLKQGSLCGEDFDEIDEEGYGKVREGDVRGERSDVEGLYWSVMGDGLGIGGEFVGERLEKVGISYDRKQFYDSFTKSCIKTDWQSTVFEIKYGYFKTKLKVITMRLEPKLLFNRFLAKGAFGEIYKFQLGNETYVLKNIKINNEQINLALRQVFLSKLLSCLEISPKFSQIFLYDAIIFKNSVYFAMQECRTNYTDEQIQQQLKNKSLRDLLKIMHHLHLCHADIKEENVGWSQNLGRFVFLDFNLSVGVKEQIGDKTLSGFLGTYNYCSPEMKKIFFLKTKAYVDLYLNDVHCLQRTWEQLRQRKSKSSVRKHMELHVSSRQKQPISSQIQSNNGIVRYFQFKSNMFDQKYDKISTLLQKQPLLIKTLRRVAAHQNQPLPQTPPLSSLPKQSDLLTQASQPNDTTTAIISTAALDRMLYQYEIMKTNQPTQLHSLEFMLEISQSEELFGEKWQDDLWKEKIFFFIDVYSNLGVDRSPYRKKFIQKIYQKILPNLPSSSCSPQPLSMSPTLKFRQVLLFYSTYFKSQKNIPILQKILTYFLLLWDDPSRQSLQSSILQIWESQKKYEEYLRENLKYFVGKIVMASIGNRVDYDGNVGNVEGLIGRLGENQGGGGEVDVAVIREKGKKSIQFIKLLGVIHQHHIDLQVIRQKTSLLRQRIKEQRARNDDQVYRFMEMLINFKLSQLQLETSNPIEYKYENHYLQKCLFVKKVGINNFYQKGNILKQLLSTQQFTRQFQTFSHFIALRQLTQPQKYKKFRICQQYLIMNTTKDAILRSNSASALVSTISAQKLQTYSIHYLNEFNLTQIKNLHDILRIKISLLSFLVRRKLRNNYKGAQENSKIICGIILGFLEITEDYGVLRDGEDEDGVGTYVGQGKYMEFHWYLKIVVLMRLGREREGFQLLMRLMTEQQNNPKSQLTIHYLLCGTYGQLSQKLQTWITTNILKTPKSLLTESWLKNFILLPQIFSKILKANLESSNISLTIHHIRKFSQFIYHQQIPIVFSNFLAAVIRFVGDCLGEEGKGFQLEGGLGKGQGKGKEGEKQGLREELRLMLEEIAGYYLGEFGDWPAVGFLVGLVQGQLRGNIGELLERRLRIIRIMYAKYLSQGFFQQYHKDLHYQLHSQLHKKPHPSYIRKYTTNTQLLKSLQQSLLNITATPYKPSTTRSKCKQVWTSTWAKLEKRNYTNFYKGWIGQMNF